MYPHLQRAFLVVRWESSRHVNTPLIGDEMASRQSRRDAVESGSCVNLIVWFL